MDGADLPLPHVSKMEQTVALHQTGRDKWETATLRLKATLPQPETASGPWTDVECLAVLSETVTNTRTTARLSRARDGSWQGSIELARARHLNRASLTLTVVGTVDGIAGRMIGSTERPWYIDLALTRPVRQQEIEVVEVDFRGGPLEWLRPFKDAPWIVETTGDVPTVYLNSTGVEGLVDVMHAAGGTPDERLLLDMTAAQIAQDAWIAMFHAAISDLDLDEDGTPLMPTGWREPILRMMLPDVLPGRQLTDALYDIDDRRTKGFGWSEVQTSIQYAAGKRSQISRKLTNAVRSVNRSDGSGNR
ncbi:hypothetical protein [Kibdelosporangium phytohabitans]|uniref:hypothetical protein n=1 Tax=Kibdelosporangium phytohabitans TaxID=860235 RepID=UPI001F1E5B27|nr:hypothetical protein [Kibdelosporangium phytohabitans]